MIAIVTGAGSGIGRAVALALAKDSHAVVLAGRRPDALERVVTEIDALERVVTEIDALEPAASPAGTRALAVPTDITDEASVARLFARAVERFGRVDLLFNNAGVPAPPVALEDITIDQWRAVVDVNLTGAFLCTREAFRVMKAQTPRGGRIINNGSISAHVPRPGSAPYTATKHAITGLTRSTSLDGRAHDIACGQIDIGNAATDMTARMTNGVRQANGTLLAEPRMNVDDVARAVIYMASLPLEANVQFMTVMATTMPYIGRG